MRASHRRILWALLMRELATRYGRRNLGFLWLVAEPLLFCAAVLLLWSAIRSPFEHGVRLFPFLVTGYVPLTLLRHTLSQSLTGLRVNSALLYHRQITTLHLLLARVALEVVGVSLSFFIVIAIGLAFGLIEAWPDLTLLYGGWLLLAGVMVGMSLIFGALGALSEVAERVLGVTTYILVPLSGVFVMADWLPPTAREALLLLPFAHCIEMMRGSVLGPEVRIHYDVAYVCGWIGGLTFLGLLLLSFVRRRLDLE